MGNPALRVRLKRFSQTMESPFAPGLQAEKLTGARYPNRYSLRLSDAHRAIFDQVDQTIVFRALNRHEESYTRAERLPAPNLARAIPFANIYSKYRRKGKKVVRGEENHGTHSNEDPAIFPAALPIIEEIPSFDDDDLATDFGFEEAEMRSTSPGFEVSTSEQYLIVSKGDELLAALGGRMAEWMLFLPDEHRRYVTMLSKGPTRIFGPSGTGKTCILLHKAVFWARQQQDSVLILTFRPTLVKVLTRLKDNLCSVDFATSAKIRVGTVVEIASELLGTRPDLSPVAKSDMIFACCRDFGVPPASLHRKLRGAQSLEDFVENEITHWIKGAAYGDAEIYQALTFPRGKAQLSLEERSWLFEVFELYENRKGSLRDDEDIILDAYEASQDRVGLSKWSAILIDEFQDISLCSLSFLKNLGASSPERLFFAGDHRQRLYRTLPSFKDAGIAITGRSYGIRENYRNTPEIYKAAHGLCSQNDEDPDAEEIDSRDVLFTRSGAGIPVLRGFATERLEMVWVCDQITSLISAGTPAGDIAIISLSLAQTEGINWEARFPIVQLDNVRVERLSYFTEGAVRRATIHESKGLEFPVVFLTGLSEEAYDADPALQSEADPDPLIRSLLYVAMTRARDKLFLSFCKEPLSQLRSAQLTHFDVDEQSRRLLKS